MPVCGFFSKTLKPISVTYSSIDSSSSKISDLSWYKFGLSKSHNEIFSTWKFKSISSLELASMVISSLVKTVINLFLKYKECLSLNVFTSL